jgi:hypothetical protein
LPEPPIEPKQHLSKRALTFLWLFLFAWHFPPAWNKRNGDAMTFKSNRTIKRRHLGKPAAADDNKDGQTVLIGGLVNCFRILP